MDKLKHFAFPPFSSKDISLTWNLTYSSASDLNGEGSFLYVVKEALSSFGLLWSQAKRFEHLSFSQVPQQSTCPFQRRKEFINADPFQSNPVPLKMNTLAQGTCVGLMSKRHTQPRAQPGTGQVLRGPSPPAGQLVSLASSPWRSLGRAPMGWALAPAKSVPGFLRLPGSWPSGPLPPAPLPPLQSSQVLLSLGSRRPSLPVGPFLHLGLGVGFVH